MFKYTVRNPKFTAYFPHKHTKSYIYLSLSVCVSLAYNQQPASAQSLNNIFTKVTKAETISQWDIRWDDWWFETMIMYVKQSSTRDNFG